MYPQIDKDIRTAKRRIAECKRDIKFLEASPWGEDQLENTRVALKSWEDELKSISRERE